MEMLIFLGWLTFIIIVAHLVANVIDKVTKKVGDK